MSYIKPKTVWCVPVPGAASYALYMLAAGVVFVPDKALPTATKPLDIVPADPKATERKQFGLGAMIYLFIFSILLWFSYKAVWKNVDH